MSYKILFIIFLVASANLPAQDFGFGCLGLVGGYAGYEIQNYKPTGLNTFMKDSLSNNIDELESMKGFRLGINFF